MKKVILMAACVFALNTINAQEPTPVAKQKTKTAAGKQQAVKNATPEQHAQKTVDKLTQAVGLSEDQKTKIYELALTRSKEVQAVREKYKGQADKKETAQAEMETIRKTFRKSAKSVLTAEQLEKLKAGKADKNKAAKTESALDDQD